MTKKLDDASRDLLAFRPNIAFVEPDQEEQELGPFKDEEPQLEDILAERKQVKKLAEAVNALATAVQARVDLKAKDVVMVLDPLVDGAVIQAMRVCFPQDIATQITYAQYKHCKDDMRLLGVEIAKKTTLDPVAVQQARDEAVESVKDIGKSTQFGGFNTPEGREGRLRPEVQARARIIDPIDLEDFQVNMICVLVNYIWKHLIKPVFDKAGIPAPIKITIGSLLPDRICDPGFEGPGPPGFLLLGEPKVPDIREPPVVPKSAPEAPPGVGGGV